MKRSPQVRLSAAVKRSLLPLSILSLALLLLGSPALATTPITVTIYQDMESGNAGDVLTASIMNASSHGVQGWTAYSGTMWVSTAYHRDLPGPVIAGGVTYNGTSGSRCWVFNDNLAMNCVQLSYGSFSEISEACYYTTGVTLASTVGYDNIIAWGNSSFQCMQTLVNSNGSSGLVLHCHSKTYLNTGTNHDPISDSITVAKTYWVCMNYDGSVGQVNFMAFDPDNGYAQVGTTLSVVSTYGDSEYMIWFGRGDNHGNQTNDLSKSYFDQILIDSTNAAFPLLPSGANDTTAPSSPASVRDGTGQDQSIALSTTQLSANWDPAVDNESGIKGYQYAIGTTQGGTNVTNWTTLINKRGVTQTGLSLTTGQTYYFSVKAINGVGLVGPAANSNGQTVGTDTTPPSAPAGVRDGGFAVNYSPDIDETTTPGILYGNFDPANDNESGISFYQYAYGTTPGGTDTLGWQTFPANWLNWSGLGMNAVGTGVTLTPGTRYYCSVRAVNNAGLTGPATNSNGQVFVNTSDTTPPSAPPAVRDGTASTETSTTTSTTQLSANWDNSTDNESGISGYYYAIGTTVGGSNIVGDTRVSYNSPVSSITRTGLSLTVGQTYYFRIKAINGVPGNGLTGPATNSSGVTVVSGTDSTPPSAPPAVRDGTGADISTTVSTTQLSANWDASTDNESGISGYQYAIGTSAGGTQTVNWTSLGNVLTVTKTGLTLSVGQTYYFSVKAVNGAGLTGGATNSNGQTVVSGGDVTPPSAPPAVRDGLGADISTTNSTTQLSANWDASTDNESGISGYQYAIGTSAGGTQTVNWTSLGNVTTVTKTGLTLNVGQTYYFSVKAVNGAGLTGGATNSNGQTVVSDGSSATPVDLYQDMESGNNGDLLTATIMNASSHPGGSGWDAPSGSVWVSTSKHSDLPGPVIVGGVTYNGTGGTRAWVYNNNNGLNYVRYSGAAEPKLTVGCYYTTNTTIYNSSGYVVVSLSGVSGMYTVMSNTNTDGAGPYLSLGSKNSAGTAVNSSSIKITAGKTYWVNIKYDGAAYTSSLALFDPANSFAQVGSTTTVASGTDSMYSIRFGRIDNNGNQSADTTQSWFDQVIVDWTNAAFPLIPSSGSGATTYFSDNFENWTVHGGAWSSVSGETSTQTLNTSTDYARAGTKSLKLTDTDTTNAYGACLVKNFSPTISGDVYVRFYVFLPTGYASTNPNAPRRVLRVNCQTNRGQMSFTADAPLMEEVGAWGAAQGSAVSENAWHCIEMHMATPSASTLMEFWVDGIKNSGTLNGSFSGSTSYDGIWLGDISTGSGTNGTGTYYLDELVVSNAYNGPLP